MAFLIASRRMARVAAVAGGSGALVAGLLGAAGPAGASTVTCGMTVTSSVTLTHNLNCRHLTSGAALTVGAAGVTVNLNGHRITGPGPQVSIPAISDNGYDGIRVEKGTISNFFVAVAIAGTVASPLSGAVVRELTITGHAPNADSGVFGQYLTGASINHLAIDDALYGIELYGSQASMVTHNRLTSPFVGMADIVAAGDTWAHNVMTGVGEEGLAIDEATGTVTEYNTISGAPATGIYVYESTKVDVVHNNLNHLYTALAGSSSMSARAAKSMTTEARTIRGGSTPPSSTGPR